MTDLSILFQTTQHHYNCALSLSNHLPEVLSCTLHGILGHNECFLVLVTLKKLIPIHTSIKVMYNLNYIDKCGMYVVRKHSFQLYTMFISCGIEMI